MPADRHTSPTDGARVAGIGTKVGAIVVVTAAAAAAGDVAGTGARVAAGTGARVVAGTGARVEAGTGTRFVAGTGTRVVAGTGVRVVKGTGARVVAGTGVAIVVARAGPGGPTLALAQGPLGQKSPTPMHMSAQPLKVSWGPQPSRPVGSVRQASVWTSALCAPTPQLLPVV